MEKGNGVSSIIEKLYVICSLLNDSKLLSAELITQLFAKKMSRIVGIYLSILNTKQKILMISWSVYRKIDLSANIYITLFCFMITYHVLCTGVSALLVLDFDDLILFVLHTMLSRC